MIQNYSRRSLPPTKSSKIKTRENCTIGVVLKLCREEVLEVVMETSFPKCLEVVVVVDNREDHKKANLFNITLKLPLKKFTKVKHLKSL